MIGHSVKGKELGDVLPFHARQSGTGTEPLWPQLGRFFRIEANIDTICSECLPIGEAQPALSRFIAQIVADRIAKAGERDGIVTAILLGMEDRSEWLVAQGPAYAGAKVRVGPLVAVDGNEVAAEITSADSGTYLVEETLDVELCHEGRRLEN